MSNEAESKSQTRPMVSVVLDDETIIEMVHRREEHQTAFLAWKDGDIEEQPSIELPRIGRIAPYSPDNNLLAHGVIRLASDATDYGEDEDLFAEVRGFIHRYADVSEIFEEVASYYVLLTWIYDAFSEVPYLRLKGDFGSGKSRCLLTIGSLCYKPMFMSGASTISPIFRIIDAFRGTLVIDESDFRFSDEKAEIVKILNNGNATGFPVLRSEATPTKEYNPRAFTVFGPKIIATRAAFQDRALESRCITEAMRGLPPRPDIPLNLPKAFHAEAEALRNKLLMYRFKNLFKSRDLTIERNPNVEARVAQVFAPLLSIIRDPEAHERVSALARNTSGVLRAERSGSVEAQLLGIIWDMRRDETPLSVKEIAERFATNFGADFPRPITPRWIGAQLRNRLSVSPVKSHGTFVVPETEASKITSLFERYSVGDVAGDMGTLGTSGGPSTSLGF